MFKAGVIEKLVNAAMLPLSDEWSMLLVDESTESEPTRLTGLCPFMPLDGRNGCISGNSGSDRVGERRWRPLLP